VVSVHHIKAATYVLVVLQGMLLVHLLDLGAVEEDVLDTSAKVVLEPATVFFTRYLLFGGFGKETTPPGLP